jgi:hypothetical protein
MQEAALFSLCGVQTVVTNHWATKPEDNLEIFEQLLRGSLTDGHYLGASLKRWWEQTAQQTEVLDDADPVKADFAKKSRNLFRHNTCTYGVPLVRII